MIPPRQVMNHLLVYVMLCCYGSMGPSPVYVGILLLLLYKQALILVDILKKNRINFISSLEARSLRWIEGSLKH